MAPRWSPSECLRCVACVGTCPTMSMTFRSNVIIIDNSRCNDCGICMMACPVGALKEGK